MHIKPFQAIGYNIRYSIFFNVIIPTSNLSIKYLFSKLLREAVAEGELHLHQVETAAQHLYGILESFILNLTITDVLDERGCLELIDGYIQQLK